jgi:hypothetical protein
MTTVFPLAALNYHGRNAHLSLALEAVGEQTTTTVEVARTASLAIGGSF